MQPQRRTSLLFMLVSFTALSIFAQSTLFLVHYNVSALFDSVLSSSLAANLLHINLITPLLAYAFIQILAYVLLTTWIYVIAISLGKHYRLSHRNTYYLGLLTWAITACAVLSLNSYYYPHSFFAVFPQKIILITSTAAFVFLSLVATIHLLTVRRAYFLSGLLIIAALTAYPWNPGAKQLAAANQPNVIIIGLDSLRPDAINAKDTPAIYDFMQSSHVFTNAYTPLARTYPAWITMLTGLHPKHSGARTNMIDPTHILQIDNLAKKLKSAGYFTLYGTDLPRFTDIDQRYGFDRIMQPKSGLAEFMLADLYDFPLSNLLLRLPGARTLFPYNYGNRTAAITYDPDQFLDQVQASLSKRPQQPLFLALHLCLAHWPHTFARDGESNSPYLDDAYRITVKALDAQFASLLNMLTDQGLLTSSVVVIMSDHGVTLGQPDDRAINIKKYLGKKNTLQMLVHYKLNRAPEVSQDLAQDYTINTSYGMGTDILSLKQNQIVLAFKVNSATIKPLHDNATITLADVAPTLLNYLRLSPLNHIDGKPYDLRKPNQRSTAIYLETGDKVAAIEKADIAILNVVQEAIGSYDINANTGMLTLKSNLLPLLVKSKQHAIVKDGWMLARYPQGQGYIRKNPRDKFNMTHGIIPAYYVLLNLKTGQWTMDLSDSFAKGVAPGLLRDLNQFYGDEIQPI